MADSSAETQQPGSEETPKSSPEKEDSWLDEKIDQATGIYQEFRKKGWKYISSGEIMDDLFPGTDKKDDEKKEEGASPKASPKICKFAIKYHKSSSSDSGTPPSNSDVSRTRRKEGDIELELEVKENENGLAHDDEYFLGWSEDKNDTLPTYSPGQKVTHTWSNNSYGRFTIDLYPIYANSGVVMYFPDENTNEKYSRFTSIEAEGPTTLIGEIFTREGYTQVGWTSVEGGDEKTYDSDEEVTLSVNDRIALYPYWELNTHEIELDMNIDFDDDDVPYSGGQPMIPAWARPRALSVDYGSTFVLPVATSDLSLLNLDPDITSGDIEINDDLIELDSSENSGWTYDSETELIYVSTTNYIYHKGFYIESWNEDASGLGTRWEAGQLYELTRDESFTLYAIWVGLEHTVYYRDEDTPEGEYIHTSKVTNGKPFYTDRLPYPSDKQFHTFNGWIADDGTVLTKGGPWFDAYTYGSNPIFKLDRDLVLTRQWIPYCPVGKIFFGGVYSDEVGVHIEKPPSIQWPEYNYEHEKVYGRNGDILKDNDRYENASVEYEISAYDGVDYRSVSKKVSEWLHRETNGQYLRLEDSYEPDIYRLAIYEESNTLENIFAQAGKCTIVFNCKPQKFLLSGDVEIETAPFERNKIINPTNHSSCPLLKIYGTGTLTINDAEIVVQENFNYILLDTETYDAVEANGYSMNQFMYTMDSIKLKPGENLIEYIDGIEKVIVIPRWWRV